MIHGISAMIVVTTLVDIVTNAMGIVGLPSLSPIVATIWGITLVLATVKYKLMDINPSMAAEKIAENIGDSLFLLDETGNVIWLNDSVSELVGINKDNIIGIPFISLLNDQEKPLVDVNKLTEINDNKHLNESITSYIPNFSLDTIGKSEYKTEEIQVFSHGEKKILECGAVRINDEDIFILLRDVTKERMQNAIIVQNEKLVSIGEMVSGVAHELNNPLTSITMLSSMLTQQMETDNAMKNDLTTIHQEAGRAADIVRSLLSFARKKTPEKKPVNINKILDDVVKLRSYEHKSNNIVVIKEYTDDLPDVCVDYQQMQQVFLNLIINAEQAMIDHRGKGTLKVKTDRMEDNVAISIIDDGPGIMDDIRNKIFNPFFTSKEEGKGTGLGLSISYGIIANRGGNIYFETEIEQGTCFIIEIPLFNKNN